MVELKYIPVIVLGGFIDTSRFLSCIPEKRKQNLEFKKHRRFAERELPYVVRVGSDGWIYL